MSKILYARFKSDLDKELSENEPFKDFLANETFSFTTTLNFMHIASFAKEENISQCKIEVWEMSVPAEFSEEMTAAHCFDEKSIYRIYALAVSDRLYQQIQSSDNYLKNLEMNGWNTDGLKHLKLQQYNFELNKDDFSLIGIIESNKKTNDRRVYQNMSYKEKEIFDKFLEIVKLKTSKHKKLTIIAKPAETRINPLSFLNSFNSNTAEKPPSENLGLKM